MKNLWKKMISVLLVVLMTVGILSVSTVSVFAEAQYYDLNGYRYYYLRTQESTLPDFGKTGLNIEAKDSSGVSHLENIKAISKELKEDIYYAYNGTNVCFYHYAGDTQAFCSVSSIPKDKFYISKIEKLSATFSDLQTMIDSATINTTVKLEKDYTYDKDIDSTSNTITINKTITLDLNGHTISGNNVNGNSVITIKQGATLSLVDESDAKNGKITGGQGCSNKSGETYGGGVYNDGTFVMSGGNIIGNAANVLGGGVCNWQTFIMNGGTISNNTASSGGGVYSGGSDAKFVINGGTISGNTVTNNGAGVFVNYGDKGFFIVGGTANICGNKKEEAANNVYLNTGNIAISSDAPLSTGASIGVNANKVITKDSPQIITETIATDYSSYFFCDDSAYAVKFNTDHLELVVPKKIITPSVSLEGWTYGENAKTPVVTGNTGKAEVTYSYKVKDAEDSTYTATVPTNAGTYTVKADIKEITDYDSGSCTADFTIAKAKVIIPTAITGLVYDGNKQLGVNYFDNGIYTMNGTYIMADADNYKAFAHLNDTNNYEWADGTITNKTIEWSIAKAEYNITSGANITLAKGSIGDCSITIDGPYVEFQELKINGEIVDTANYTVTSGSTIITLKKAYLETLSVGDYDVEMIWKNGFATTTITIKATPVTPYVVPKTGVN